MSLVAYDNSSDESEEEIKTVKKRKESVKIRIPSLKEFEEEEEEKPLAKKPKLKAGSGLFSLLPPPKNTSTLVKPGFVPHILKSKKEQPPVVPSLSKNNAHTEQNITSSTISEEHESEEENLSINEKSEENSNAATINDFFWLDDLASSNKKDYSSFTAPVKNTCDFTKIFTSQLPSTSNSDIKQTYLNESMEDVEMQEVHLPDGDSCEIKENPDYNLSLHQQLDSSGNYSLNESAEDSEESLLKDKEFLKLQGRRREFGDIDIIDVNADDQLTNKNEWLMKNMTEETTYRPKRKHNMPTQQQKRKHQITYLAFQAKEREMDLKNQWALNSRTRRETQAKYGF